MTLDVGGPLWMFQVWVQTYFRQLRPSHPFDSTVILGRQIISLGPHAHSVAECFAVFLSKKSMTKEEFSICYSRDYPSCLALNITKPWERSLDLSVLLPWGRILISRDINYGLKGTLGRPGVEVYLPNFVARQLGFIQSCPAFFLMSQNRFSSWRGGFTDTAHCLAVTLYYQTQFGDFERSGLSAREPDHRATPTFQAWWSTFIKKKFGEDFRTTKRIALYGFLGLFTNKGE
ncbi:putative aminotransferase-like, plant mobile domain-containing protein [Rosa chinensis]|uniref:Putative aminotransferase-like, plant mobile domain-containing protein n=1 Tax=Rosa chinensis TaxID=74649 RepID=A0A2P6PHR1_ROSCH|nr:putative aminotransferase-like, plant mobile domain-containing protein [Rosa chinensis]